MKSHLIACTIILLIIVIIAGCTNKSIEEFAKEESAISERTIASDQSAVSEAQSENETDVPVRNAILELEPIETFAKPLGMDVIGLSILRYKKDGDLSVYDFLFDEYYERQEQYGTGLWPDMVSIGSHYKDIFMLYLFAGRGVPHELLYLLEDEILFIKDFDYHSDGALLTPIILKNGLIAYGTGNCKTQYKIITPDLQEAVKLQFDYGEELIDADGYAKNWGYERIAVSITYDEKQDIYIMVYTTNPWLYREGEDVPSYQIPYSVGVATFDLEGNRVEDFLIPVESKGDWLTTIGKGYLNGSLYKIYQQGSKMLLRKDNERYCSEIDLDLHTYRKISGDEFKTLFPPVLYPDCPLTIIADENGVSIYNTREELLVQYGTDRNPVCYAAEEDGTCYLFFELLDEAYDNS